MNIYYQNQLIAGPVGWARTLRERSKGLLGHSSLQSHEGLVIDLSLASVWWIFGLTALLFSATAPSTFWLFLAIYVLLLLIVASKCIHTIGMHFPIDIIFLNRSNRVLQLASSVRPGRLVFPRVSNWLSAARVLELAAGRSASFKEGDQLEFRR